MPNALVDVAGSVRAGNDARQSEELNALRIDAGREQLNQATKQFSDQERQANTQFLHNGAIAVKQNPRLLLEFIRRGKERGAFNQGFDEQKLLNTDNLFDLLTDLEDMTGVEGAIPAQPIERNIIKDAAGFQRDIDTGERLFPDVEIPAGSNTGTAGALFDQQTANFTPEELAIANRVATGLRARAGTVSARERIADDPTVTDRVAGSESTIAGSVETAKQRAQIAAIPAKVQAQYQAEFKAGAGKRIRAANDAISRIDSVMQEAELAIDDIGITTTGLLGSVNRKIAGTTAFALARKIDTIQANLSFDRIAEMRKNSPTGGALGQVSERELSLLGAAVVALDQANNEEEVRRAFTKVLFHYNNWKAVLTGQINADELQGEIPETESRVINFGDLP